MLQLHEKLQLIGRLVLLHPGDDGGLRLLGFVQSASPTAATNVSR